MPVVAKPLPWPSLVEPDPSLCSRCGARQLRLDPNRLYPTLVQPVIDAIRKRANVLGAIEAVVRALGVGEFPFGATAAHHPNSGENAKRLSRIARVWARYNAPWPWAPEYANCGYWVTGRCF